MLVTQNAFIVEGGKYQETKRVKKKEAYKHTKCTLKQCLDSKSLQDAKHWR